ncbi:MAG TPA: penicillin-binding protein 2 [Candidatus Acidoferrales bacterium]|nr:penicillin-binding protein 2 [Candidatus Acidoferrales bacterium]
MAPYFGNDQKLPHGRLVLVSYLAVAMVLVLLFGFWKLQVIQGGHYSDLAEKNQIRSIPIIAPRGTMLDREGRVLVDSYPSFSILLLRDDPKLLEKSLPQVEEGLNLSHDDLKQQLDAAKFEPKFQPIVIKPEATQGDIAFVDSHRADLPVLELMMVQRRRYAHDGFFASAAGYVGEVTSQQLDNSNGRYRPGDIVGKAGLEHQYNDALEGTDGMRRVIVNSVGKMVRTLDDIDAIPGKPIQLTIDSDLQNIAETDLAGKEGAAIVMDPRNGEVLAFVSRPTFDPNDFAVRIDPHKWQELNSDPQTPLLNRVIQAQLAPGSVFKIVTATAMLESKAIPQNMTVFCPGYGTFYGRVFKCWVYGKSSHGVVDLHKAITQSCDIFFYTVGMRLGIDKLSYYASNLGIGRRTGIDLPGEEPGLMPSEEWTQRVFHRKWYPGETVSVAIGQGAVTATPIQLARMIAGVASGGTFVQPHLLKNFPNPQVDHFPLSENTIQQVTDGMYGVVNEGGTGAGVRLQNVEFCGKSGTAQVIGYDTRSRLGKEKEFKDNAWFVGYAPRRNPEIVVAVLVQGGGHGAEAAAPVARDIVKAYYEKKNGSLHQNITTQTQPVPEPAKPAEASLGTAHP